MNYSELPSGDRLYWSDVKWTVTLDGGFVREIRARSAYQAIQLANCAYHMNVISVEHDGFERKA